MRKIRNRSVFAYYIRCWYTKRHNKYLLSVLSFCRIKGSISTIVDYNISTIVDYNMCLRFYGFDKIGLSPADLSFLP